MANEGNRTPVRKRGAALWTPEQRSEFGRKGGMAKVKKGLAKLPKEKVQEITSQGGRARQFRRRVKETIATSEIQSKVRGD